MLRIFRLFVFSLLAISIPLPALAFYAGDLDASFGGQGYAKTSFNALNEDDRAQAILVQPDNKLVVAASSTNGFNDLMSVIRYNPNGTLDVSFDGDGHMDIPNFRGASYNANIYYKTGLIRQADGQLVLAGYVNSKATLVRLNAGGGFDTSFGTGGQSIIATPQNSYAQSVAQQADGKLVVGGYINNGINSDFFLSRLNTDGSLDTSFDGDGIASLSLSAGYDYAQSVIVQADGKLVIAGCANNSTAANFALVRYNPDGSLDTTFDTDGIVTTDVNLTEDCAHDVVQQADGKLVATGYANFGALYDATVVRYNTDGSLDTNFSTDGKTNFGYGTSHDYGFGSVLQADGKLVVGGLGTFSGTQQYGAARLNTDGTLDTTFSADGKVNVSVGPGRDHGYAIALQSDGKAVMAGAMAFETNGRYDVGLLRLNTDGSQDTTFDTDGIAQTNLSLVSNDSAKDIAVQPDGKIVVVGETVPVRNKLNFAIARFNADGTLDTSFDGDGKITYDLSAAANNDSADAVLIQPDGKILVAGYVSFSGTGDDFFMHRYNDNGSLDTTFGGGDGKITTNIGAAGYDDDQAKHMILQSDGQIVLVGQSYNSTNYNDDFAIARYNPDGSPDTSFGGDGSVTTEILADGYDYAYSVAQQADGKLVVTGTSDMVPDSGDFILVRYNADGSLDTTFDDDGIVFTDLNANEDLSYAVIQLANGKLLAAGSTYFYDAVEGWITRMALVRYNADGSVDTGFGVNGKSLAAVVNYDITAYDVIEQADGKIVVAGSVSWSSAPFFALARFNADGSPDPYLDQDGVAIAELGVLDAKADAISLLPDGKILVGGSDLQVGGTVFTVLRFHGEGDVDNDTVLDNTDTDDDNDTYNDIVDAFPLDASEWVDTDGDAVGNNADLDDDADGMTDIWEKRYHFNSLVNDASGDGDSDGTSNLLEFQNGTNPVNPALFVDKNDFNKDGVADILLKTATGVNWRTFTIANAAVASNVSYFGLELGPDWATVSTDDFDADGDTDTLFRNTVTGDWKMARTENGTATLTGFAGYTDINWSVAGLADFDANGIKDILMRDALSGSWRVFYISEAAVIDSVSLVLFSGSDWGFQHAADFDADGDADVLLRNSIDGSWRIFTLQSGAAISNIGLPLFSGFSWSLAGVNDMNKDGDADLLMRNTNGAWRVYTMQSGALVTDGLAWLYSSPGWTIDHLNDVDNDGDKDFVMRSETGDWRLFIVQNGNIISNTTIALYPSLQWQRIDVIDVNGNGVRDVLMRNTSTADWRIFTLNNGAVVQNLSLGLYKNASWVNENR